MLNNDVKLIGVALSNYEKTEGKMVTFKLELEKQKSGSTYAIELKAFTNSKSINFGEKIKGKLVAIQGFLDDKTTVVATNVMVLVNKTNSENTASAEVVTSKDLENSIVVEEDDLPF